MSLALAGQFTSKFSGGHHDTKAMNLGRPLPEPTPGIGRQRCRRDTGKVATFYSSRSGNHTGLGLTACSHMVSTLKRKLFISRIPDAGTVVHLLKSLIIPAAATG